jgi:predicted peroxiredoxin
LLIYSVKIFKNPQGKGGVMKHYFFIFSLFVIFMGGALGCSGSQKYLIILQAGTESHEGMARAAHALLYSTELKEKGYDVVLMFDGAGTSWAQALQDPKNKLHEAYQALRAAGVTKIICDYCAGAFKVKEDLIGGETPLVGEYKGHPSFVKWVKKGYRPIIL